jgi:hypothetical protein
MLRLSARRWRWAIRLGSVFVLLLAVLPQILYLGNPAAAHDDASSEAASSHHANHEDTAAQHANHCHVGPKSCAGSEGAVIAPSANTISALPQNGMSYAVETDAFHTSYSLWQRPEKPPRLV